MAACYYVHDEVNIVTIFLRLTVLTVIIAVAQTPKGQSRKEVAERVPSAFLTGQYQGLT